MRPKVGLLLNRLTVFKQTIPIEDYIQEPLNRYQYSEEVKEAAAFHVLFGGEDARQNMQELGIHSVKTIHHWVADYQQMIEQGRLS